MNWIIRKRKKMRWHTYLPDLLVPLHDVLDKYKWFLSDIDFMSDDDAQLPIDFDHDWFVLNPDDFKKLAAADVQIIWGVLLAIPKDKEVHIDEENIPFVEGNENIWLPGNIQAENAEIEIDCFDSGYTIVKFKSKELSDKFSEYFDEAIPLEKFKG